MKYFLLFTIFLSCFEFRAQDTKEENSFIYFSRTGVVLQPIFGNPDSISSNFTNGIHSINGGQVNDEIAIGLGIGWEKSKKTHSFPIYLSYLQDLKTIKKMDLQVSVNYGFSAVRQVDFGEFSKYSFKPLSSILYIGVMAIPATGSQSNFFFELAYRYSSHPIEKSCKNPNCSTELINENWHGLQLMLGYSFN